MSSIPAVCAWAFLPADHDTLLVALRKQLLSGIVLHGFELWLELDWMQAHFCYLCRNLLRGAKGDDGGRHFGPKGCKQHSAD